MERLSLPIEGIKDHYDAIVVGSGYGGGIAASRLSRAGRKVCVIERGKELHPGEYPDSETQLLKQLQVDLKGKQIGSRTAMFDLRFNDDMNVIVGCGLGGTSLINANVALRADPRIFEDEHWPAEIRDDASNGLLDRYYGDAEEMLGVTLYPGTSGKLAKFEALEESSRHLDGKFGRTPIHVTFKDGVNHAGVMQKACIGCGDCVSGCNHHAKNTVLMNYLPDAKKHGAEIFTEVCVRHLERRGSAWVVHFEPTTGKEPAGEAPARTVSAPVVCLCAGTLGSTEILLRSRELGLETSNALGARFSGNGDMVGWTYNADRPIRGIGWGRRGQRRGRTPPGPCVAGIVDDRDKADVNEGRVMEEAVLPGAFASLLPAALAAGAKLMGSDTDRGLSDKVREKLRQLKSLLFGPYTGAVANTQTYLVVAHDDSAGRVYLENDRVRVSWPGAGRSPLVHRAAEWIREASRPLGGTFVKNPVWNRWTNNDLITGHPLGGCVMANRAEHGVVNHKGQVYRGVSGEDVHEGLYVMDGAVVPRSLGVNPLLVISALAERSCHHLLRDHGWARNAE